MRFESTLRQMGNNTGIEVPPEVLDELGGGRRPAVDVTVNGFEYRSTVASMGGKYLIAFSSDKRAASGIRGGDAITVDLTLDTAPRTVDVPEDLASALAAGGVTEAFEKLSPSAKKAHVTNVLGAKAAETRSRRIESIVDKLS
ncbi:YdeI/OmpD-associated family protein [Microbacterium sp. RU33B]|uniref:YdeI/OmpD-associated family protein n=1 Tax=Microbacterium sp. RU33B TaxID=1907390 RepID=UPI00096723B9|nr:YdeI/OmpD-associated family protein [Microbacterium sp. RU33B]SIT67035.1 Bacteriocin-protection, YdeI or OmpD-Associated [Microbacterium sp. RU33B]